MMLIILMFLIHRKMINFVPYVHLLFLLLFAWCVCSEIVIVQLLLREIVCLNGQPANVIKIFN